MATIVSLRLDVMLAVTLVLGACVGSFPHEVEQSGVALFSAAIPGGRIEEVERSRDQSVFVLTATHEDPGHYASPTRHYADALVRLAVERGWAHFVILSCEPVSAERDGEADAQLVYKAVVGFLDLDFRRRFGWSVDPDVRLTAHSTGEASNGWSEFALAIAEIK